MQENYHNEFNARTINCKLSSLNQVILPKRIIDEYRIEPHDTVGLLGKRAHGVGVIVFHVGVHQHNNSVSIPKQIVEFCGFETGTTIKLNIVGFRRTHKPDTPAPPVVS